MLFRSAEAAATAETPKDIPQTTMGEAAAEEALETALEENNVSKTAGDDIYGHSLFTSGSISYLSLKVRSPNFIVMGSKVTLRSLASSMVRSEEVSVMILTINNTPFFINVLFSIKNRILSKTVSYALYNLKKYLSRIKNPCYNPQKNKEAPE